MNPNKTPAFFLIVVTSILLTANTLYAQARPVLLFSDLTWGPKTGWEGSATKGAAVTIWGKNVGSANGTNKITACGIDILSNDSTYVAEWGVTGTANHVARGLERITFWLKNTMTDGSGTISVTVGGVTSNTIPFTIAAGKIYFISVPDGDNSYNGLYSTRSGHSGSDGPFKDLLKFNPSNNPSGDSQYICYVRGGTYTTKDVDSTFVALRGPYGGPTKQKALIAYPAEVPTIDTTSAGRGIIWNADYDPYGMNSYFTYSKLYGVGGWGAIGNFGNYNRTIGCHFKDYLSEAWTGVVLVVGSKYTRIYGNYFDHNGYDSYKHNIYIKTQPSISGVDYSTQYTDVGWNEISNPVAGSDDRGGAIFISKSSDSAYDTRYVYIHDNYFHDGNMEFIYTGDNTTLYDIYIYDNIFTGGTTGPCGTSSPYTCPSGSVFLAWDTDSVYLFNNTFYNTISPIIAVTGATHAILRNNIYYANNGQTFFEIDPSQGATISSDHDLFYNSSGGGIPSGPGITLTNGKTGNPLFVNPAAKDFHLQPTSPAIDAGSASVSSTVTQGYDGNSRPQGSGYDIGAYEYAAGGESESFPFTDDFSTDKGWIGYEPGGWERGPAVAGGGGNGNPDPSTDHSSTSDNYILGFAIGADYPNDSFDKSIISPPVDCTGQSRVYLKFWRYLNVESNYYDHAKIYLSNNGTNWTQLWENPVFDLTDNQWIPVVFDISSIAANKATVYIKFTMGPTNSSRRFSGWNIDDLEVTSDYSGPLALYVPSEDTPNPNIDEIMIENGLGVEHSNVVPGDLSSYTLLIISKDEACNPGIANSIKTFIQTGGGAIIMSGTPRFLAGNTDDLSSIMDWFGGGSYGNDCGYGVTAVNNPFGTDLLVNDIVDYVPTSPCSGASVNNLDIDATYISNWSNLGRIHSFKHTFGQGRVFYYGGKPGYSADPNPQLIENGLTLFEAGLLWASNPLPSISVSPLSKDFGNVNVGSKSSEQKFTISNIGGEALIVGTLTITGKDTSQFSKQNDMCSGQTVSPLSNCTVGVIFSPTLSGTKNASLSIPSNDPDIPTSNASLTGTGVSMPIIGYSPASFALTATKGGSNPPGQTLNIVNSGAGTLNWSVSEDAKWLRVSPSNGKNSGTVTVSVNIANLSSSTFNATITITASGATNSPVKIPITLTVLAPDLIETYVSNPPATAVRGSSFSVTDTVKNQGNGSAGPSTTRYYLSTDNIQSKKDKLLAAIRLVPALAPGATNTGTVMVTVPSKTSPGTYYLLACSDDTALVGESNEANNCISSSTTVQITP